MPVPERHETSQGLQAMRGLAAAMVVFVHYSGTALAKGFAPPGWTQTTLANAGVDVFFVISGFIMEFLIATRPAGHTQPGDFLVRRAIRLLPLSWAMTGLAVLAHQFVGNGPVLNVTPARIVQSLLLMPDPIVPMAWSLTYEVYFYLLFALLLRLTPVRRFAALAAWFVVSVAWGAWLQPKAALLHVVTDPILFEFLGGVGLALLWRRGLRWPTPLAIAVFAAGAVALYVGELVATQATRAVAWGVPAWSMVAAVVLARRRGLPLWLRPGAALGDVSYSLYLSHFFVVAVFQRAVTRSALLLSASPWLLAAIFAAAAVLMAAACYRWIEQPTRRLLTRAWLARTARDPARDPAADLPPN